MGVLTSNDVDARWTEPLRSSLGSYVAETAFIRGKNLIVEGTANEGLLAGISNALRARRPEAARLLNLNEVAIVPSGSADSVPYIAYLARGRDPIKPSCVSLLDGDDAGRMAVQRLRVAERPAACSDQPGPVPSGPPPPRSTCGSAAAQHDRGSLPAGSDRADRIAVAVMKATADGILRVQR